MRPSRGGSSKGEASALLKWKIFSLAVVVTGLFSGLPWGLTGVAGAYVLTGVFVRFPLLFWYTGRKVGIPLPQLFGSVMPVLLACAVASSIAVYRHVNYPAPGLLQSCLTLLIALPTFGLLISLHRQSRNSVRFVVESIRARFGPSLSLDAAGARVPPAE